MTSGCLAAGLAAGGGQSLGSAVNPDMTPDGRYVAYTSSGSDIDPTDTNAPLGDQALGWSLSPEFFTYSASKHAWVGVMDLLAAACAPRVRANMVALAPTLPGVEDTPEMFARLAARSPLARTGTVEEVLAAVDYLLASPGVTGQILGLGNGLGLTTRRV